MKTADVELSSLALEIREAFQSSLATYAQSLSGIEQALQFERQAGELLIRVKRALPHGHFIAWIKSNCDFSDRQARRFMTIATDWEKISANWEQVKSADSVQFEKLLSLNKINLSNALKLTKDMQPATYTVTSAASEYHNQQVEVVEDHQEVVICRTPDGEKHPFLKAELGQKSKALAPTPIVVSDQEDNIREAIAFLLEYLPGEYLQRILMQILSIGIIAPETKQEAMALAGSI